MTIEREVSSIAAPECPIHEMATMSYMSGVAYVIVVIVIYKKILYNINVEKNTNTHQVPSLCKPLYMVCTFVSV